MNEFSYIVEVYIYQTNELPSFNFLFVILQTNFDCFSQNSPYPFKDWVDKLSSKKDDENNSYLEVRNILKMNFNILFIEPIKMFSNIE